MATRVLSVSASLPGCHRRIGDALAAAPAGAVVNVHRGEYRESLRILSPVTVVACDGPATAVLVGGEQAAVSSVAGTATLRGLAVRGSDAGAPALDVAGGHLRLEGCELSGDALATAVARNGASLTMADCRVENAVGAGVVLVENAGGVLERCTFTGIGGSAVVLRSGASPLLRGCIFDDVRGNAVGAADRSRGRLEGCRISAVSGPAIALDGHSHLDTCNRPAAAR